MKILSVLLILFFMSGCSKMEEKKTGEVTNVPDPHSSTSGNTDNKSNTENKSTTENKSSGEKDEKAAEVSAAADKSISNYESDKSDANKKEVIDKCLTAANYLMFDATLPAREKYRPALKYYRMVLEADPQNEDALKNKNEIERIYESMGMPIPK